MNFHYDLAVAWRIYPGISKSPIIHSDNKFELVKVSLLSFLKSAGDLSISYYFILDGCPAEYKELIQRLFANEKVVILETPAIGNLATFKKQVEILTTQKDAGTVYFAEDDYLYLPGEFGKVYSFLQANKDADFVSSYLHNDIFTHPIHDHKRNVKYFAGRIWLEANSTCLTFMTSVDTLKKTKRIFLTYTKGNNDCALWLVLTKTHILNPFSYLKFLFTNRECAGILKRSVVHSFMYFFSLKSYKLWVPFPSVGTHLESGLESPGIDWVEVAKTVEEKDERSSLK